VSHAPKSKWWDAQGAMSYHDREKTKKKKIAALKDIGEVKKEQGEKMSNK